MNRVNSEDCAVLGQRQKRLRMLLFTLLREILPAVQERTQKTPGSPRMEEKIKDHYRRPSDDQPPPDAVIIPPLTEEQYVAIKNWNVAAQVGVYGITAGISSMVGAGIGIKIGGGSGGMAGGVIGAIAGVMWGAYEANCIASVQDEFDEAYKQSGSVTVWREGWKFNVDGNSGDYTYIQANAPLSALYVAGTTLILTGKIP